MAVSYEPIRLYFSQGEGAPAHIRESEGASKTFKMGVPLVLSSGNLQECAFGGAEIVYGVSSEAAHNLTTANTAQETSYATPPNQASAKTIAVGSPIVDGKIGCYKANGANRFSIMLKDGQVFAQSMIGSTFGLTKDATSGFWYLDNTDTTGDNAVARCEGLDPSSPNTAAGGARVFFTFVSALRYFQ
jgi:hypothetical protein